MMLCLGLLPIAAQAAGDIEAGRDKAKSCARCHGPEGVPRNARIPVIAGQDAGYLMAQLHKYRNRELRGSAMQQVARTLSDQDIEDLAAYFASLGGKD